MSELPRFLDGRSTAPRDQELAHEVMEATPATLDAPRLLEAEHDAPGTVGADWNPVHTTSFRQPRGSIFYIGLGLGIIFAGWILGSLVASLIGFFRESLEVGVVASSIALAGGCLAVFGIAREWRSLRALSQVDVLRTTLIGGTDTEAARRQCQAWLSGLDARVPEAPLIAAALTEASSVAQLRGLLRSRLSEPLRLATRAIGIRAASEVSALVAVSPHASWDGAIVALRGLKVIREVAQLYGLRPGPAVIAALLRRVARSAVETATLEATSQAAADHFLNNLPLVRHLGAVAGASTAAFRMYRLANVTAQSCSPFAE